MATQTSRWHLLPDLCLQRVCTYSRQLQTLFNLLLVCQNFYYALPIPKEFQKDWDASAYRPLKCSSDFLWVITRDDISVSTVIWFVRMVGIVQSDVVPIQHVSVEILRFFINLYGASRGFLDSIGVFNCPVGPRLFSKIRFLLEELHIEVKDHHKYGWFMSACGSGDVDCIKYVMNELDFMIAGASAHIAIHVACKSGSIAAVEWLMETLHITPQTLNEKVHLSSACESGNVELVCHLWDKYNMRPVKNRTFCTSSYSAALKSNNLDLFRLVEEMYGDQTPECHHYDIVSEIYERGKGTAEEKEVMMDYVCHKFKIDPRTDDGALMKGLCSLGSYKTLATMQSKFNLTKDDAVKWNLLLFTNGPKTLRTLRNVFGFTKQDIQVNNCEVLRRACADGKSTIVSSLYDLFGLSKEDAMQCGAVGAVKGSPKNQQVRDYMLSILLQLYGVE